MKTIKRLLHGRLKRVFLLLFLVSCYRGQAHDSYDRWVEDFKTEAQTQGIRRDVLDEAFRDSAINQEILELDRKQPESVETFETYVKKRLAPKLPIARTQLYSHRAHLRYVQKKYKVPAPVLIALWGMETHFGEITGNFSVINALATLAFDGRRRDFFKNELIEALKIVQNEKIPLEKLQGSWAGALGQAQFMPSTYNLHAVDEDQDQIKDIWGSHLDVFASMANYLSNMGWQNKQPWGYEVTLPRSFNDTLISPKEKQFIKKSTKEWATLGVRLKNGKPLPKNALKGAIIQPDNKNAFLVYDNFFVIFQWNRSFNFALTVLLLSNKIGSLEKKPLLRVNV